MNFFRILFLTFLLITGTFFQSQAQSPVSQNDPATTQLDKQGNNYALLVRNFNHLRAAVKTVVMITADNPNAVNKFEVVICGRNITNINEYTSLVNRAQNKGITLTACGMSMNKFSMDKSDLPKDVGVVENGLIRIFELQDKGYKTITL